MTGVQALGVLAIRLWAAATIFAALAQLRLVTILWLQKFDPIDSDYDFSISDFFFLVWLVAGFVAWFAAPRLVNWVLPATDGGGVTLSVDAHDFVRLGSFLIGSFFLIDVGPSVLGYIVNAFAHSAVDELGRSKMRFYDIGNIVAALIKFLIALVLILSPRGLAKLFATPRTAGLAPTE